MKKQCAAILVGFSTLVLCACTLVQQNGPAAEEQVTGPVMADHPLLSEQEMLLPCFECHKDVTPEIYEQWYDSAHGIGNVKCYQCHGTYENLQKVPGVDQCAVCHAAQVDSMATGKICWDCHLNHTFKGH